MKKPHAKTPPQKAPSSLSSVKKNGVRTNPVPSVRPPPRRGLGAGSRPVAKVAAKKQAVVGKVPPPTPNNRRKAAPVPQASPTATGNHRKRREAKAVAIPSVVVEKEHAKHGPSSLKNKEQCSGFVGRDGTSDASAEGTLLHKFMEDWGRAYVKDGSFPDKLQTQFLAFTDEQQACLTGMMGIMREYFDKYAGGTILFEYEFDLTSLGLPGCEHGTADVAMLNPAMTRFAVVDYKLGKWEVDAPEDNVQFFAYVLGGFAKWEHIPDLVGEVLCLQPRCDVVGTAEFTRDQIPAMRLRLKTIVERAEDLETDLTNPNPFLAPLFAVDYVDCRFNPQPGLCEFCANVGWCPAVAQFALKVNPGPQLPDTLDPYKCPEDKLGALYAWAKITEESGKALAKAIVGLAGDGYDIVGYNLINSSGKSSVCDPLGLLEELGKRYNITAEQLLTCAEISIGKIEEIIAKGIPEGGKAAAKDEARAVLMGGGYFSQNGGYSYLKKRGK